MNAAASRLKLLLAGALLAATAACATAPAPPPGPTTSTSDAPIPSPVPAADETPTAAASEVADMCARLAAARDGRVERLVITRSPRFGVVWRADQAEAGGLRRVICTGEVFFTTAVDPARGVPPLP